MGAAAVGLVSAGVGAISAKKGRDQAKKLAAGLPRIPKNIRTGNSSFDTKKGIFEIDPSIRQGLDDFSENIRGLKDPTNAAFDVAGAGIRDLQARSADIRKDFEGNQSAFRDRQLASTRASIASRKGELDRSLARRDVFGSFGEQAKNALGATSSRELRFAEAEVENQRLNSLGDFLQIDANLLKAGLVTETGRTGLIAELEESLRGVSTEKFAQEIGLLGLPLGVAQNAGLAAKIQGNAQGIVNQAGANLIGEGIGAFGGLFGGGGPNTGTGISPTPGDVSGTPF